MLARATSPCRLVVSSPTPALTTPHTPSLHPSTFHDITLFLPGEGTPFHSVSEDFLFLHGSKRGTSTAHIVLANVISLALPINLLVGP